MRFDILTIFPDLFSSFLQEGIIRRAMARRQIEVRRINIRDFASDKHAMTDDRPFGGGEGMVMKPEPLAAALGSIANRSAATTVLLSPKGRVLDQAMVEQLAKIGHLVLVCGRYEGVDERIRQQYIDLELSIGDYILTGGELAAMVLVDSVTRLLPGVLGCADSADKDSFSCGLLKHPQYTRPQVFAGMGVPDVLLSGDHARVANYRFVESVRETLRLRPGLLAGRDFSKAQKKILTQSGLWDAVQTAQQQKPETGNVLGTQG